MEIRRLMIQLRPLLSTQLLDDPRRRPALDLLRGLAILSVVLYHAEVLPYGFLGVDLFFVLSGYLVGGVLLRQTLRGEPIRFGRFILQRGFKIWPSYYAFLLFGQLLALALYSGAHPDQVIPWAHLPMYLFFYRNYRGHAHWSFDHVWSLCVEEHFYLLLPLALMAAGRLLRNPRLAAGLVVLFMLCVGITGKMAGYFVGFETYSATHNRMDALAWGVLVFLLSESGWKVPQSWKWPLVSACAVSLAGAIGLQASGHHEYYGRALFHSTVPVAFAALLLVCHDWNLRRPKLLRYCGYYSYNWYLWHAILTYGLLRWWPAGLARSLAIVGSSFALAMAFTVAVEEPFLALRERVLPPAPRKS